MSAKQVRVLERILDPVSECFTPEVARSIANCRIDDATQSLLDQLAEKSTAGTLTAAERSQYESYVNALDFVAVLQSKARRLVKRGS